MILTIDIMRVCWNWQTGTFEVRVLNGIRVQVPSPAPVECLDTHFRALRRFCFLGFLPR